MLDLSRSARVDGAELPTKPRVRAAGAGLNENLARELLELHTLGVGGPYDQQLTCANWRSLLTGMTYTDADRVPVSGPGFRGAGGGNGAGNVSYGGGRAVAGRCHGAPWPTWPDASRYRAAILRANWSCISSVAEPDPDHDGGRLPRRVILKAMGCCLRDAYVALLRSPDAAWAVRVWPRSSRRSTSLSSVRMRALWRG